MTTLITQIDVHSFCDVQNKGHALNGIGKDNGLEHEFLLQGVVRLVNDPHLLEKGRFAALGRSKQKDLNLVGLVPKVQCNKVDICLVLRHKDHSCGR